MVRQCALTEAKCATRWRQHMVSMCTYRVTSMSDEQASTYERPIEQASMAIVQHWHISNEYHHPSSQQQCPPSVNNYCTSVNAYPEPQRQLQHQQPLNEHQSPSSVITTYHCRYASRTIVSAPMTCLRACQHRLGTRLTSHSAHPGA